MTEPIIESGMSFISDNAFHIEKSPLYLNTGKSVKSVEFIRIVDKDVMFVEAKTTFSNPQNRSGENYLRFEKEIGDICEKFIHSLNLYSSIKVGIIHNGLPLAFNTQNTIRLVFVLVIKNHNMEWCGSIKKKIINNLPDYFKKIWKPDVYVMNQATAIKRRLAANTQENN